MKAFYKDSNLENVEQPTPHKSPVVSCPSADVAPENDDRGIDNVGNIEEFLNAPSTVTSASYPGDNSDTSSDEDYYKGNSIEAGNAVPASAPQDNGRENPLGFDDGLFIDPGTGIGPFNMATPYGSAFLPSVLVASVDEFHSAKGQVTDTGFCVRCLKLLSYNPDHIYSCVNLQ